MEKYLELGKVNNTHGLKGEVKFEMWCDGIDYVRQLSKVFLDKNGTKQLTLVSARPQKNIAILKFAEIPSINEAEELKGKILYCDRDEAQIDDDAFYIADIIGCRVTDADTGEDYGKITDVQNYGSCDIYDVKNGKNHTLIPAIPNVIVEIDTEKQVVLIKPMKGLFDEN
ncbi:MAG: 16S rRNA processing protein RimM [Eubacterium sp.]|nr:16S rRNA processing protein RimM [Eubacterium sp.]